MKTETELLEDYFNENALHAAKYFDDATIIEYKQAMSKTFGFKNFKAAYQLRFHWSELMESIYDIIRRITGRFNDQ